MRKNSSIASKIIILVLILATPGFLYYLLTVKGKNRYKPLPIYGPKQPLKTGHRHHGHFIPDTLYHTLSPFKLTDQQGNEVSFKNFEGKIFVVSFFYTRCPSVCNEANKNMQKLAVNYAKNRMVRFASITVDPDHDTQNVLNEYAARYKASPQKWMFLRGDTASIYNLARNGFLVNAVKVNNNEFVYSNKLILIDQEKRIRGYYTSTSTEEIARLNDEIKVLIAEELRKIKAPDL